MELLKTDARCRVTIGKKAVTRYGRRFRMVDTPDGILLLPVSKDPVKGLRELGRKAGIGKYSINGIKKMIATEAEKEALRALK